MPGEHARLCPVSTHAVAHIISAGPGGHQSSVTAQAVNRIKAPDEELSGFSSACALLVKSQILGCDWVHQRESSFQCRSLLPPHPALSPVAVSAQRAFVLPESSQPEVLPKDASPECAIGPGTSKVSLNSRIFLRY